MCPQVEIFHEKFTFSPDIFPLGDKRVKVPGYPFTHTINFPSALLFVKLPAYEATVQAKVLSPTTDSGNVIV